MALNIKRLEITANGASVKVSDKRRLKAIQMKAEAEGITVDQFCQALSRETQELYRQRLYPTKFGTEEAWRDESGSWRMRDLDYGSQPYTLQRVMETNLYIHIRAYLMGLILSEKDTHTKRYGPGAVILREDNKVAIVKRGRLKLQSADEWFSKLEKRKGRRIRQSNSQTTRKTKT